MSSDAGLDARSVALDQLAAAPAKISQYDMSGGAQEFLWPRAAFPTKWAHDDACADVLATILHGAVVCAIPF